MMKPNKFTVTDAHGNSQTIEASSIDAATAFIERTGKRNLFGVEGAGKSKFFLDRGHGILWPIGARTAALELQMGDFEK